MKVQTVLGSVDVDELGRTLVHEHLFISLPGAEFDPQARFDRDSFIRMAVRRLIDLKQYGVKTFVDPCPIELGRDVTLMAEISERSEMNIICTTGFYFEGPGIPYYWRSRSVEEIADFYITELEKGVNLTKIRPGAIKCATGAPAITQLEEKFLAAASVAQRATNVPIITHTQSGLCGPEQQQLFDRGGVALNRCLIGHSCGSADGAYHRSIVDRGSYIGFDRIGLFGYQPDDVRADCLVRLFRSGFGAQILISQDRFCGWHGRLPVPFPYSTATIAALNAKGAWPPLQTYLFTDFIPMLRDRGLSDTEVSFMLDENPRRFSQVSIF